MKYLAIVDDDFLSYFELDDNGKTLVLTDKRGYTRAVRLLPYEERPQGEAECMEEDAKQASIPYTYSAPQHDWKCGYPDCNKCGADMRPEK